MAQGLAWQHFKQVDGEYTESTTRTDLSATNQTNRGERRGASFDQEYYNYDAWCRRVWKKIKKRLLGRDQLVKVDKESLDRAVGNRPHQVRAVSIILSNVSVYL